MLLRMRELLGVWMLLGRSPLWVAYCTLGLV